MKKSVEKQRYFIVKWREPFGVGDDVTFKVLVIANSEEDAENKVRTTVNGVTGKLEITDCTPDDGIIFLGTE